MPPSLVSSKADSIVNETTDEPVRLQLPRDPKLLFMAQHKEPINDDSMVASEPFGPIQLGSAVVAAAALVWAGATLEMPYMSPNLTLRYQAIRMWSSWTETGFYEAFSLVFLSEVGDKTFFIAALLAMKISRLRAYVGAMMALIGMTTVSVGIGQMVHSMRGSVVTCGIPLDDIFAVGALAFFGLKMLKEAIEMDTARGSIMAEELADAREAVEGGRKYSCDANETNAYWSQILGACSLIFVAEFGDMSFLSTIALGAAQSPTSVAGGAIAAHGLATAIAVSFGSYFARYASEKVICYTGGVMFLAFAVTNAIGAF